MKTSLKEFNSIDELLDVTEELLSICKSAIDIIYDNLEDMEEKHGKIEQTRELFKLIQNAINKAEGNN